MRFAVVCFLLALFITVVAAWTKEDYEIFDLVSALEASEGKGTTFYSWLEVPSIASLTQINKAYRKKSMQLHPDKNPGVKGVQERFARLGVIVNILRSQEGRARYDFFYKNGVPKWRGTGYYYARFRPGLGSVVIFLVVLTSGLQYLVQRTNYKQDLNRVRRTIREARLCAWGPKMVPLEGKRKVKVNLGGGPRINEDGKMVPGKMIDMVVEGDHVYILDPSGELQELSEGLATPASFSGTWLVSLLHVASRSLMKAPEKSNGEVEAEIEGVASETVSIGGSLETEAPWKGARISAVKVGGRRRRR